MSRNHASRVAGMSSAPIVAGLHPAEADRQHGQTAGVRVTAAQTLAEQLGRTYGVLSRSSPSTW